MEDTFILTLFVHKLVQFWHCFHAKCDASPMLYMAKIDKNIAKIKEKALKYAKIH